MQKHFTLRFFLLLLAMGVVGESWGQVSIISLGTSYTQNFDVMGSAGTTTPTGWWVGDGTTATLTMVVPGTGNSNAGGNYNFGVAGTNPVSDRALGSLTSSSTTRNTEARFTNNTGFSIESITVTYDGEQWRLGQTASSETGLELYYSVDGTNFVAMGSTFDFVPPVVNGTAGALDGNLPANRIVGIGGAYTLASPITNGTTFYLRWVDTDNSGSDAGIAVDNFSISASDKYISAGIISTPPFCIDATNSASGTIAFTTAGNFSGQTIIAYLSDASGSFASPINIGSTTVTGVNPSGSINITIPNGTASGTAYKIRIDEATIPITGSASTSFIINYGVQDVTAPAASVADLSSNLTWINPIACYDEILIVAATAANTGTPTGDGSGYTGSLSYGSGTVLGNGFVVYKGTASGKIVTALINGTPYFYKFFTRYGSTWSTGIEVSATANIPTYFWNGGSISANPANGGSGTWSTANAWRQPTATGAQATWTDNSNAVFAGVAGVVSIASDKVVNSLAVNTSGYTLTPSSNATRTINGNMTLAANVQLSINDLTATTSRILVVGNISGGSGASLGLNVNQNTNEFSRLDLASPGATLSLPITVFAGGNGGTKGNVGVVAKSTNTTMLSSFLNNTVYKTIIGATSGNSITVNGVISGSADLMFAAGSSGGAGTITLNAANIYTGATLFNATNTGTIKLGVNDGLSVSTDVTMGYSASTGGIFDLNGFSQTIASLTSNGGGGSITNNGAADATLTINGSTTPAVFALPISDGVNKILLTRVGTGSTELSTTCGYTGLTTVNGGLLKLSKSGGTIPATNDVVVNGGILQISTSQTLANVTLGSGATLTVDNTRTLTITGTLTVDAGAIISATGTINYAAGAALVYTGTGSRTTGIEWTSSTVNNVTIGSNAIITVNSDRSLPGTLFLINGILDADTYSFSGTGATFTIAGTVRTANLNGLINSGVATGTTFTGYTNGGTFSTNVLDVASTIDYNAGSGNQNITGAVTYVNLIASGGATKAPSGATAVSGTLSILDDNTILNGVWNIGGAGTSLVMTGSSLYKITVGGTQPIAGNASYSLSTNSTIEFTGLSATNVRVSNPIPSYGNIIISGSNVSLSTNGASIKMQGGTTFAVTSTGTFNVQSSTGFTGAAAAAVSNTNSPAIDLQAGSTINYNYAGNQPLTGRTDYKNLIISGSGVKAADGDVTVGNTITLTAGELGINGHTLTANGAFSYGTGTLTGSSTSKLILGGAAGNLNFTQTSAATRSLKDLTLNASGTATVGTALDMYGNVNVTNTADNALNFNDQNVTLKSDVNNTATIDKLNSLGTNLIGATNVTVERWIPLRLTSGLGSGTGNNGRAYRVLTSTVSSGTTTINTSWQEGLKNITIGTYVVPDSPYQNFGTHITGAGGSANGFDITQTNESSLYTFTNGSNINSTIGYPAVGNTNATIDGMKGYFMYIRGDRNVSTQLPYQPAGSMPTSSTTLRAKGSVLKGNVVYNISPTFNDFSLITNPYPAPLDWDAVSAGNSNISTFYTFWDPNTGIRGGFTTIPTGGGILGHQYIQPGEGFFVQNKAAGFATVTITEAMKAVGKNENTIFGRTQTTFESFRAELYLTEANNVRHTADEVLVRYDNNYSASVDMNDAEDIDNWNENIAINRGATRLAIESRPVIMDKDTIPLFMNNMRKTAYEFEFTPSLFSNTGLTAELIDNYLNSRTLLSVTSTVTVPFTVNNDAGSFATNRFMVVFGNPSGPLPIDLSSVKAYEKNTGIQVDWVMNTEQDMDRYEVEKSADGRSFAKATTVASKGNSPIQVNYGWFDANPIFGDNFYRIKSFDKSGQYKYSNIVRVNMGKGGATDISIYPNPYEGNGFNLQMNNLATGTYTITIYNNLGQRVYSGTLTHSGGSATQYIDLGKDLAAGTYTVKISGGTTELSRTITKK